MMVDSTRQSDWDPGISARQDTYSKAIPIDFDWTNRSDKYAPTGTLCVSVGGHGYACCYWQRGKRAPALFHFHPSHAICGDTGCTSWVRLRVCPACIPPVLRTLTSTNTRSHLLCSFPRPGPPLWAMVGRHSSITMHICGVNVLIQSHSLPPPEELASITDHPARPINDGASHPKCTPSPRNRNVWFLTGASSGFTTAENQSLHCFTSLTDYLRRIVEGTGSRLLHADATGASV
ncbi:hypothetical protein C8J57DRAFT_1633554 [Mycena rebaudengoi]|nr:hypothetical protein C8J57DRAFT_1633554 [Mycena rebaudengoi]